MRTSAPFFWLTKTIIGGSKPPVLSISIRRALRDEAGESGGSGTQDGRDALLLLLARDELDALVDSVDGLTGDSNRHDRGTTEVLLGKAFDRGGHRGGEHDLRRRSRSELETQRDQKR